MTPPDALGRAALAVVVLTLLGCASSLRRADRLYEAGAYGEAAAAYEAVLSADAARSGLDRVLLRLAVLYAWPEGPAYDEERARELLGELTRRFASGPLGSQAARFLDSEVSQRLLREEAERLRREVATCRDQLEKLKAIDTDGSQR